MALIIQAKTETTELVCGSHPPNKGPQSSNLRSEESKTLAPKLRYTAIIHGQLTQVVKPLFRVTLRRFYSRAVPQSAFPKESILIFQQYTTPLMTRSSTWFDRNRTPMAFEYAEELKPGTSVQRRQVQPSRFLNLDEDAIAPKLLTRHFQAPCRDNNGCRPAGEAISAQAGRAPALELTTD